MAYSGIRLASARLVDLDGTMDADPVVDYSKLSGLLNL